MLEPATADVASTQTTEAMDPVTITLLTGPEVGSALDLPVLASRLDAKLPWD